MFSTEELEVQVLDFEGKEKPVAFRGLARVLSIAFRSEGSGYRFRDYGSHMSYAYVRMRVLPR